MRFRNGLLWLAALACLAHAPSVSRADNAPAPSAELGQAKPSVIDATIRAIANDSTFKNSLIGIAVMDVDSGELLGSFGEHTPLNPASNAKVYTAACALAQLHGNYTYSTSVHGRLGGANVDNLVLRGSGDPSLETDDLLMLARALHMRGVRRVDGDILLDQRFFDDQTTPPAFEQQPNEWASFRAPVSAIAVNENTVTLTARPGAAGGNAIFSFDPPGFVDVEGVIRTGEPGGTDTVGLTLEGVDLRLKAKVSGQVSSPIVRYAKRSEDPRLLAGYVMRWALEQFGIKVGGEVKLGNVPDAPMLASHRSKPLSSLLYALGKSSNNFYAEMVFKSLSKQRPASSAAAAAVVMQWLAKNDLSDDGLEIKNGSGLFDSNRVTASSLVRVLRHMWRDTSTRHEFVSQLAIGGVDGTLQGRFHSHARTRIVRAKTGTLESAISLAGYVLGPPDRGPIAFAVIFNKVAGKVGGARGSADRLVSVLAEQLWRAH